MLESRSVGKSRGFLEYFVAVERARADWRPCGLWSAVTCHRFGIRQKGATGRGDFSVISWVSFREISWLSF